MFHDRNIWKLACDMARSGEYANVIIIEQELRRRGLLSAEFVTTNIVRRELLTRICHAVRNGDSAIPEESDKRFRSGTAYRVGYV
jgi:hypothetical protein